MLVKNRQYLTVAMVALAVVAGDLITKEIARGLLAAGPAHPHWLPDSIRFVLAHNAGAAGGVSLGDYTRAINIISTAFVVLLATPICTQLAAVFRPAPVAIGLVVGAAMGNLVSLVMGPAVVDFIAIRRSGQGEIIFNIADVASMAGLALMLCAATTISAQLWSARTRPAVAHISRRPSLLVDREVPLPFAADAFSDEIESGRIPHHIPSRPTTILEFPRIQESSIHPDDRMEIWDPASR